MKGRIYIHKDGIQRFVKPSELNEYKNEGWEEGRLVNYVFTDDFKSKIANHVRGKIKMYNSLTDDEVFITKDMIGHYNSLGYDFGRRGFSDKTKYKMSENKKGRIHINNGHKSLMIYPEELSTYIKQGYQRGRLKTKK
jgi:hypothetical protein